MVERTIEFFRSLEQWIFTGVFVWVLLLDFIEVFVRIVGMDLWKAMEVFSRTSFSLHFLATFLATFPK